MPPSKHQAPLAPPLPRLYLATPRLADVTEFAAQLPALLETADVAAVLLRLADTDERTLITRIKTIAPVVQATGAALLVDRHYELVAPAAQTAPMSAASTR